MTETLALDLARAAISGVVLLGLVALTARFARRSPASARRMLWASAPLALLASTAGALWAPKIGVPVLPALYADTPTRSSLLAGQALDPLGAPASEPAAREDEIGARPKAAPSPSREQGARPASVLLAIWALVAAAFALPAGRRVLLAERLRARARPCLDAPRSAVIDRTLAKERQERSGREEGADIAHLLPDSAESRVAVREHEDTSVPVTVGLFSPVIVLPSAWHTWSDDRMRSILLHELAHVRRRDCLVHALAELARALHWFNPLAHLAVRRLEIERELAADDFVLAHGAKPSAYARDLLAIASSLGARRLAGAAIASSHKTAVEQRVENVLAADRARSSTRTFAAATAITLFGLTALLACVRADEATSTAPEPSRERARDPIADRISERIAPLESKLGSAALVIGVLIDGEKRIVARGRVRDDDARPPDGDTVFTVGSITELFSGLVFADLVSTGQIDAGIPARELLPAGASLAERGEREITLLDLASHTSGLPPLPDNFIEHNRESSVAAYTPAMMYAALEAPSSAAPGTFRYSYFGVGLLGHLLALRERSTYRDLVFDRVLRPLHLEGTDFFGSSARLRPRMAMGHDDDKSAVPDRFDTPVLGACCAIRSSANDLLALAEATLAPERSPLEAALRAMQKPVFTYRPGESIGIGWHLRGPGLLFKRGGGRGFSSFVLVDPERDQAIVILAGTGALDADALAVEVARAVAR
jgi:serine-type D-Ala-D-Ala carboxypeptidase/endopeptidase